MKKQEKIKFKQMIQDVTGVGLFAMYVMYAKAAAQGAAQGLDEPQTWDWMRDTCAVELTARLNIIDKGKK